MAALTLLGGSAAAGAWLVLERGYPFGALLRARATTRWPSPISPAAMPPSYPGEMGVPPTAPALMNAVFAATGRRIRHLPIRPEDLADPGSVEGG